VRPIKLLEDNQARLTLADMLARLLLLIVVVQVTQLPLRAQSGAVEARIASVRGQAVLSGNARTNSAIARGMSLMPGDRIDTRGGGSVSIELSDGSLVIVQPGTIVVLQDYLNASSLRQLLEITVGRVRVRINHFGGRPNPYRVNSPTASIAVRGTEFSVVVGARGDTQVVVYEGLVDVASIAHPQRRVRVEAGHGVIIRANEDIRFFIPGPNNEIGERTSNKLGHDEGSGDEDQQALQTDLHQRDSVRTAAGVYERYFDSIVESVERPLPSRFTAFPDSYFDSVDNPAYATEFSTTEARVFMLPSIGGTQESENARQLLGFGEPRLVDYSLSPQVSVFVPLQKYRAVIGGRVAISRDGFQSFTVQDNIGLTGSLFSPGALGTRTVDGSTTNRIATVSLEAARRFGRDGRTSIGFGVEHLTAQGKLLNTTTQTDAAGFIATERVDSRSAVNRTRFTFGFTRLLGRGEKLGVFYRYGVTSAQDRERSRTLNGESRLRNRSDATGSFSEFGAQFRGTITRRLFYGIEGSYLSLANDESIRRKRVVDSSMGVHSTRAALGLGLGYALRPRMIFSFDVAGGTVNIKDDRIENATGSLLEKERGRAFFVSLHAAVQADVWRRLFMTGSVLSVTQSRVTDLHLYPDSFGRLVTDAGVFEPDGRTRDHFTDYFSNFGIGWRLNRNLLAEYIFSTDFGQTAARHTLLFRYTFSHAENPSK
jgi:hypothetical protein